MLFTAASSPFTPLNGTPRVPSHCLDDPASQCRYDEGSHGPREIHDHPVDAAPRHDCRACGPCADEWRVRQGCHDGACCQEVK